VKEDSKIVVHDVDECLEECVPFVWSEIFGIRVFM